MRTAATLCAARMPSVLWLLLSGHGTAQRNWAFRSLIQINFLPRRLLKEGHAFALRRGVCFPRDLQSCTLVLRVPLFRMREIGSLVRDCDSLTLARSLVAGL